MKRKLSAHYLDLNDNIVVDIRIWAAMYFDVRFSSNCMSEAQLQLVRNFILAQSDKLSPLASTAVSTSSAAPAQLCGFDDSIFGREESNEASSSNSPVEAEMKLFENAKSRTGKKSDPLLWWRMHHDQFRLLSVVARAVLCIPAPAASSERLFSIAGLTVMQKRTRLSSSNTSMLVFLKSYMPRFSDDKLLE